MSGYLDHVLRIFEQHAQPFILVNESSMVWNGVDSDTVPVINVVVYKQKMMPIVRSLVQTGKWISSVPERGPDFNPSYVPENTTQEQWLKFTGDGFGYYNELRALHLLTEELFHLSIDLCLVHEVLDLEPLSATTPEEEYHRDSHDRFRPLTLAMYIAEMEDEMEAKGEAELKARSPKNNIPIFAPSIAAHVNAICYHAQHGTAVARLDASSRLESFVKELLLDRPPTKKWFLETKVTKENRQCMESIIDGVRRTRDGYMEDRVLGTFDDGKLPWELTIPKEGTGSMCNERCDYCQFKEEKTEAECIRPEPSSWITGSTEDSKSPLATPKLFRWPFGSVKVRLPPTSDYPNLLLSDTLRLNKVHADRIEHLAGLFYQHFNINQY